MFLTCPRCWPVSCTMRGCGELSAAAQQLQSSTALQQPKNIHGLDVAPTVQATQGRTGLNIAWAQPFHPSTLDLTGSEGLVNRSTGGTGSSWFLVPVCYCSVCVSVSGRDHQDWLFHDLPTRPDTDVPWRRPIIACFHAGTDPPLTRACRDPGWDPALWLF